MSDKKYVYNFEEGHKDLKQILGDKGANLAEMTGLGIKVPPGFTVTTEVCQIYHQNEKKYPQEVKDQIDFKLQELEKKMGKKLGETGDPLLVSVRSGAAVLMPGMMDAILNLGLNDLSVEGLAEKSNNPRFAWDSYRRLIQMFANIVMDINGSEFEEILENLKQTVGVELDTDLTAGHLEELVKRFRARIIELKGVDFPQDPQEQLKLAIEAVFNSWHNHRAQRYRALNNISDLMGTAVNIQAMVFGNLSDNSGTGVCFTRNPSTGENKFYGEYLMNAQGEDVEAGMRTPQPVSVLEIKNKAIYDELVAIGQQVEKHYRDMQDLEFTIQAGKLYILQTRNGKRTAAAAVKIAVDLVKVGVLSREESLMKVDPNQLDQLLYPQLDSLSKIGAEIVATGLPASLGVAVGQVVFTAAEAYTKTQAGREIILVRTETSPADVEGMQSAKGILTSAGGMTSHAAVVARDIGKCGVVGCGDIVIDEKGRKLTVKATGQIIKEGDYLTLDGGDGNIYLGQLNTQDPELSGDFGTIMGWANEIKRLIIRTNADTPHEAKVARRFGAEGIGLCRTEYMFFEGDRIKAMREMILATDLDGRKKALAKLLPYQKKDFISLFQAMEGYAVTIRLLDSPLHEFLPTAEKDIYDLARKMEVDAGTVKAKISDLHESNPLMGHRGGRLAMTYPEIYDMQVQAIIEAAITVSTECPTCGRCNPIVPEIMIPLIGNHKELAILKQRAVVMADAIIKNMGTAMDYKIGTMIEVPRAAITADQIAEEAEFFSFGTNNLTQLSCGFSRDDAGKFLTEYVAQGIYDQDPFEVLDQAGVGELIKIAIAKGRMVRSNLQIGICGEHGGDPSSVEFCHREGFDYVSCSPFRVPIAKLAAAQAVIRERKK